MKRGVRRAERFLTLVLVVLLFLAGFQGGRAMLALPYWQASGWQQTADFEYLISRQLDDLMGLINSSILLDDRESELSYVEREQLRESVERQTEALNNTWFRYRIKSVDGEKLYFDNMDGAVDTIRYTAFRLGSRTPGFGTSYEHYFGSGENGAVNYEEVSHQLGDRAEDYIVIEYGVPDRPSNMLVDDFCKLHHRATEANEQFPTYLQTMIGLLIGAGGCLLLILILAGKRAVGPEGELDWGDRISLEPSLMVLFLLLAPSCVGLLWLFRFSLFHSVADWDAQVLPVVPWMTGGLAVLAGGSAVLLVRTLILRLVTGTLLKNTWIFKALRALFRGVCAAVRAIPGMWRLVLTVSGMIAADLLTAALFSAGDGLWPGVLLWLLVHAGVLFYLFRWARAFRILRRGAETIAGGNLTHQIDTGGMPRDLAEHGEELNHISRGLSEAVDEKMKSERFKAELITNVSHDLKTPLTSIINYVDLLKTTEQTDPKALEYIEVLERKSNRLKKLTEDLVEASKASTGVLNVQLERIGMVQLLDQALGEWQDKLTDRDLTVVTSAPGEELWVYADGRHLWRVIDNLLANCCKYAMEGTRIYLDLTRDKGQVELSVKNVSREQLNVPVERLMERFVRGEESRSSEGSGLGLSIARSLTELQGGEFRLSVDGDLFKAVVSLPQAV